jgi:5-methylcytosine-specific restriction endonuclease McrA
VVSVSHRRRFTGALRRAIEVRDRHCAHPSGCEVPAHLCDVDHIVPWSQGGATSQENGRLLCSTHNRLAHLVRHRRRSMMTHRRLGGRPSGGRRADTDADADTDVTTHRNDDVNAGRQCGQAG